MLRAVTAPAQTQGVVHMIGFWTVRFNTPMGTGAGVAYFTDNEVFGGDSGYKYVGHYHSDGTNIVANLRVSQHFPGIATVFGSTQPFDLKIEGRISGNTMIGKGTASHAPGLPFQVSLTKS
jgi:hypothetical protein